MKKGVFILMLFGNVVNIFGQELFVNSEPASNMPSKSGAIRMTAKFPNGLVFKQRYLTEAMVAINKKWMVHLSNTVSDYYSPNLTVESGRVYAKYRFFSNDEVHKHFRLAAFGEVAFSKAPYLYADANLDGDNSGFQAGLIATQLVNKLAVSGSISSTKIFRVSSAKLVNSEPTYNLVNYSLSSGYLLFPTEYTNYQQTNVNVYLELLGSKTMDQNKYFLDLAPAVQFIFNSNTKVNIGYRFQLVGNMYRMANSTFQLAFEHTFFNVLK